MASRDRDDENNDDQGGENNIGASVEELAALAADATGGEQQDQADGDPVRDLLTDEQLEGDFHLPPSASAPTPRTALLAAA